MSENTDNIESAVTSSIQRLNAAFSDYLATTKKDPGVALVSRGQWLSWNLYNAFAQIAPRDGAILSAARARGWRMGRKFGGAGGISLTTWKRVDRLMQGQKSIIAYTVAATGDVSPVRVGKTGIVADRANRKRVMGMGNAVAAYKATRGMKLRGPKWVAKALGAKVLNRHAVAVALEIKLRNSGRRFLGISWLHKRWRSLAKMGNVPVGTPGLAPGFGPSKQFGGVDRVLENLNPRSTFSPLGVATLSGSDYKAQLKLTSNVPGMDTPQAAVIIARVLDEETLGIQSYLLKRSFAVLTKSLSALK